jgi:hypothetical protein
MIDGAFASSLVFCRFLSLDYIDLVSNALGLVIVTRMGRH